MTYDCLYTVPEGSEYEKVSVDGGNAYSGSKWSIHKGIQKRKRKNNSICHATWLRWQLQRLTAGCVTLFTFPKAFQTVPFCTQTEYNRQGVYEATNKLEVKPWCTRTVVKQPRSVIHYYLCGANTSMLSDPLLLWRCLHFSLPMVHSMRLKTAMLVW